MPMSSGPQVGGLDVERLEHLEAEVAALVDDADQQVDRVDVLVGDLRWRSRSRARARVGPRSEAAVEPAIVAPACTFCTALSSAAWQIDETGSWASSPRRPARRAGRR